MFLKITSIKRTLFQVMYMTMTSNQVIERNFVTFHSSTNKMAACSIVLGNWKPWFQITYTTKWLVDFLMWCAIPNVYKISSKKHFLCVLTFILL